MKISALYLVISFFLSPVLVAQTYNGNSKLLPVVKSQKNFLITSITGTHLKNKFLFNEQNSKAIDIIDKELLYDIPLEINLIAGIQPMYNKKVDMNLITLPLSKKGNIPAQDTSKKESFFSKNLFYFIGAAVVAVTVYLLWPKKESPANTNVTFGLPPLPH